MIFLNVFIIFSLCYIGNLINIKKECLVKLLNILLIIYFLIIICKKIKYGIITKTNNLNIFTQH